MVVHYQLPASADTYIHRSGRTARGQGAEGLSVALVAPNEAARWAALVRALSRPQPPPAFPVDATLMPKVRAFRGRWGGLFERAGVGRGQESGDVWDATLSCQRYRALRLGGGVGATAGGKDAVGLLVWGARGRCRPCGAWPEGEGARGVPAWPQ